MRTRVVGLVAAVMLGFMPTTLRADCVAPAVCSEGWTAFHPSPDSRIIYVSSSEGSDANDGLSPSSPRKNLQLAHDELLRDGYPDWLLLKSGDVFDSTSGSGGNVFLFWGKGGRSNAEPMRIGSYGEGRRPVLRTGSRSAFYTSAYPAPKAHLAITDLELFPQLYTGQGVINGIVILNGWSDVLIENCLIHEYSLNVVVEAVNSGAENIPHDIRLRRNVIVDAYSVTNTSTGVFVGGSGGLVVEENLFDHNGWKEGVAAPGAQSHNTYFHSVGASDGVFRGNIVSRGSAHGLNPRGGGVVEGNLILANAVGIPAHALDPEDRIVIRQNVVLDVRPAPDVWVGEGIVVEGTHFSIDDNIVAHATHEVPNLLGIQAKVSLTQEGQITNNVVYNWTAPTINPAWSNLVRLDEALPAGGSLVFRGNELQQAIRGNILEYYFLSSFAGTIFRDNVYFSASDPNGYWYSGWMAASGEVNPQYRTLDYPDPNRNVSTYMGRALEDESGLTLFLNEARKQSRNAWRNEFSANPVIDYVREGFGKPPLSSGSGGPAFYNITVVAGEHGSIFPAGNAGAVSVPVGQNQTFTIAPLSGYEVENVVVDSSQSLGAVLEYTFTNVTAAHAISATFRPARSPNPGQYRIDVQSSTGGTVSPGGKFWVPEAGSVEFQFLPENGFKNAELRVNGTVLCAGSCPSSYVLSDVRSDTSVTVTFTELSLCERVDLYRDAALNILDFTRFQQLYAARDLRADITEDGIFDGRDYVAFGRDFSSCSTGGSSPSRPLIADVVLRIDGRDARATRLRWSLKSNRTRRRTNRATVVLLRRSSKQTNFHPVATIAGVNGSYSDKLAHLDLRYQYRVLLVTHDGPALISNIAEAAKVRIRR